MTQVHPAAQLGFATEAQAYARGRPEYPAGILSWLGGAVGLAPGKVALDLGAGTGKFTKLLVQTGAEVIAVDPVAAMLEQLAQSLPAVTQHAGSAESIPLPSASLDAVVCAQAFHWFASEAALAEIHRVLRPGGKLALVWNVRDESVDWVSSITRIITPYEGDAPRFYKGDWRKPFAHANFSALTLVSLAHQHIGTAQEVILDRFLSVSFIAALPAPEKDKVADRLRALVASHPDLRGRETISFPYQTQAYCCTRLG
jgi:SAM-dependent methyltransferase